MLALLVWILYHPLGLVLLGPPTDWPQHVNGVLSGKVGERWAWGHEDAFGNLLAAVARRPAGPVVPESAFPRAAGNVTPPAPHRRLSYGLGKWHDVSADERLFYVCEKSSFLGECPAGWRYFAGSCYAFREECRSYSGASRQCLADDALLVSISSPIENNFVQSELCGRKACWIGLKRTSGWWTWEDGLHLGQRRAWLGYTNWERGQPGDRNEKVAFMNWWEGLDEHHPCGGWWEWLWLLWVIAVAALFVVPLVIAAVYKRRVTDLRPLHFPSVADISRTQFGMATFNDFRFGPCSCCEDPATCWHSLCCFEARVGDTYFTAGIAGFWVLVFFCTTAHLVGNSVDLLAFWMLRFDPMARSWLYSLILASYGVRLRQRLRARLGGEPSTHCTNDFFCWWCCPCCTVIQEARQVDALQGTRVRCLCRFTPQEEPQMLVGAPASVVGHPVGQAGPGAPVMGVVVLPHTTAVAPPLNGDGKNPDNNVVM